MINNSPIPEQYSVLVVEPTLIKGNKNGILDLLIVLANALSDGGACSEFLNPKGDAFDVQARWCNTFEQLEGNSQTVSTPDINQELEVILRQLINKHSLIGILTTLKHIGDQAHKNDPDGDWKQDADALSVAIERIEN
ncbi:hypothetical protein [Gloeothece verrucosa]|uniref:Uncharacterized protein n=1 Tax=Gloeothece verrucosa (strain PCC 7822) TaxID=497965 RepID=E0UEM6_GLOV7|nr:hypothetical protein [Gloeothece verrucosa]ADN16594.1 hypothetical protein Cyan7822_4689 [Gloeothece verrucosa PCC 7822]